MIETFRKYSCSWIGNEDSVLIAFVGLSVNSAEGDVVGLREIVWIVGEIEGASVGIFDKLCRFEGDALGREVGLEVFDIDISVGATVALELIRVGNEEDIRFDCIGVGSIVGSTVGSILD